MRIKIKTPIGGSGFVYLPNQIVEVEDKQGKKWIAAGFAEAVPVEEEPSPQKKGKKTKETE